ADGTHHPQVYAALVLADGNPVAGGGRGRAVDPGHRRNAAPPRRPRRRRVGAAGAVVRPRLRGCGAGRGLLPRLPAGRVARGAGQRTGDRQAAVLRPGGVAADRARCPHRSPRHAGRHRPRLHALRPLRRPRPGGRPDRPVGGVRAPLPRVHVRPGRLRRQRRTLDPVRGGDGGLPRNPLRLPRDQGRRDRALRLEPTARQPAHRAARQPFSDGAL
ncbi:MAG: hypothetical protein AVDCRST_MAG73-3313, partial [uncultured Thermomicrobiales bacterium]